MRSADSRTLLSLRPPGGRRERRNSERARPDEGYAVRHLDFRSGAELCNHLAGFHQFAFGFIAGVVLCLLLALVIVVALAATVIAATIATAAVGSRRKQQHHQLKFQQQQQRQQQQHQQLQQKQQQQQQ